MNHEKTLINILKCIVIFVGIASLIVRCILDENYINGYMAVVNTISVIISVNILLMDLYAKARGKYRIEKEKDNILKIASIKNKVMIIYIMIFLMNGLMLMLLGIFLYLQQQDISLYNDILGISSLILAISYDIVDDIMVAFIIR